MSSKKTKEVTDLLGITFRGSKEALSYINRPTIKLDEHGVLMYKIPYTNHYDYYPIFMARYSLGHLEMFLETGDNNYKNTYFNRFGKFIIICSIVCPLFYYFISIYEFFYYYHVILLFDNQVYLKILGKRHIYYNPIDCICTNSIINLNSFLLINRYKPYHLPLLNEKCS